ncbi:hypothetical protein [Aurantiacibacter hainanensis]|uniref:hypothetical protein n=1 Tax=Aurantiacibacter hainanensis TaxID=3076114 RepID=UPI0030C7048D
MTQQTGNDRYAGTTPARETQGVQRLYDGAIMEEPKQTGAQMDDQTPRDEDDRRREQAGAQSDRGFGYGAEGGEEMADAPDASERGYGGATEKREEKIEKEKRGKDD